MALLPSSLRLSVRHQLLNCSSLRSCSGVRALHRKRTANGQICRSAATMPTVAEGPAHVTAFLDDLSEQYEKVHKAYEDNFWATKMNLKGNSVEELTRTKTDFDKFLGDPEKLKAVKAKLEEPGVTEEQKKVLKIMARTFECNISADATAQEYKEKLTQLEAELQKARNVMKLGYVDPTTGELVEASSVQLRNNMRVNDDEKMRKACYEGLRSIGAFVAEKFIEIVKLRNKLAKLQGFEDYYDYKVQGAEGFSKRRLFEILDTLEQDTKELTKQARDTLAADKGASALEPWNQSYVMAGDTTKATDPYFPFEDAVDVWARTFAALSIHYKGSIMTLDLCDRQGKYSNGFCHWPQPAWRKADGTWIPARANFTSLATPNAVGSGKVALETLLHEGGHAAHFANVDQRSPFFSQERAPTSVAYAENQSMFLDSFAGDAAWLGRYAMNREGQPIPWELIEQHKRATHPYTVFGVRAMLAVPYFEKKLYEMPDDALTVEAVLQLADEVELDVQGGFSPRPLMSVPHILSDESSAYYHGYVLAEMSVHQTRAHFLSKYGYLIDNPQVGKDLTEVYWTPGNGAPFLDLVQQLTGRALTGESWVQELKKPIDTLLEEEKKDYEAAIKAGPKYKPGEEVDIGMQIVLVHGDEVISDSATDGGINAACQKFKSWVRTNYFDGK